MVFTQRFFKTFAAFVPFTQEHSHLERMINSVVFSASEAEVSN